MEKCVRHRLGDLVAIPLQDGRFAFGRLYNDATIAILDHVSCDAPSVAELAEAQTLFFAGVFDTAIKDGSWKIIGNIPFESEDGAWPPPRAIQDVLDPSKFRIYHRGQMSAVSREDARGLEEALMYKPEQLVARIHKELRK